MSETTEQRATRERQRLLFDAVAPVYRETRQRYPRQVVRWIVETGRLTEGAAVLEVGCGTGQLTAELARFPFQVTAIDIGAAMIDIARRELRDTGVVFAVSSFEKFAARNASLDLIVSATAAHWIDPAVLWPRSAQLLRPRGWLAIASIGEVYDEPFKSALREAWVRHSAGGGAWTRAPAPTAAERIAASGLFEPAVATTDVRRAALTPERVMNLERTRATYLDYDTETKETFDRELREALSGLRAVPATVHTEVTMARVHSHSTLPPFSCPG